MKRRLIRKCSFVMAMMIILVAMFQTTFVIEAASTDLPNVNDSLVYQEGGFDNYTNSDKLLGDENNTIITYKENCWKQEIEEVDPFSFNVLGDDPIVNIIPRAMFIHRGQYFYIGREYAFFVKTEAYEGANNLIEIFIIDIEANYELESQDTPSQVSYKVKPIFQSKYLYLSTMSIKDTAVNISNKSGQASVVIPYPYVDSSYGIHYKETYNYYLKDVSFVSLLRNEQHKNVSDIDYDAMADKGSFFIRNDLFYNGESGSDFSSINAWIKFGIGKLVDAACQFPVSEALDILEMTTNLVVDASNQFLREVSYSDNELFNHTNYASAVEQARYNGFLDKVSYASLDSEDKNPLLFGTKNGNNYITCKLTLGQTSDWYTRIDTVIKMSIVKYNFIDKSTEIATESGCHSEKIRNKEYKECQVEDSVKGYALKEGKDYFAFKPQYDGYYIFTTNKNAVILICDKDEKFVQGGQNRAGYTLNQDELYIIVIENLIDGVNEFLLTISVQEYTLGSSMSITLSNYDNFYYKLKATTSSTYEISFNHSNAEISILDEEYNILKTNNTNSLTYHFIANRTYYILIKNKYFSTLTATLSSKTPNNAILGNVYDSTIIQGDKFYTFTSSKSGYYYINVLNEEYQSLTIYKKGMSSAVIASSTRYGDYIAYSIYLSTGDTIYFGFRDVENTKLKFSIMTKENQSIKWYVNGDLINGNTLYIKQGQEKTISAKIGNLKIESLSLHPNNLSEVTLDKGVLKINKNAFPTENTPYSIVVEGDDGQLYSLLIYILPDVEISLKQESDNNEDCIKFKWEFNSVSEYSNVIIYLEIQFKDGTCINMESDLGREGTFVLDDAYVPHSIDNMMATAIIKKVYYKIMNPDTGNNMGINIYNQKYEDNPEIGNPSTISIDGLTFNSMFAGGNGTVSNPYQIKNERHLNNIRYCATKYYEENNEFDYIQCHFVIENNIKLNNQWIPIDIPLRGGSIKGKDGVTIKIDGMNIVETKGNKDIGFVRTMYGGTISNLLFDNCSIVVHNSQNTKLIGIGMIVGSSSGRIEDCTVQSSCTIEVGSANDNMSTNGARYTFCGGICGKGDRLKECDNEATISSFGIIGGIAGTIYGGVIEKCNNSGDLTLLHDNKNLSSDNENKSVGGIVGLLIGGTFQEKSINKGDIIYHSKGKTKDKLLAPRMGLIVGKATNLSNSSYLNDGGQIVQENLQKSGGFLGIGAYDQTKYAKENNLIGEVE